MGQSHWIHSAASAFLIRVRVRVTVRVSFIFNMMQRCLNEFNSSVSSVYAFHLNFHPDSGLPSLRYLGMSLRLVFDTFRAGVGLGLDM